MQMGTGNDSTEAKKAASADGFPMADDLDGLANMLTAQFASLHLLTRRPILNFHVGLSRVRLLGRLVEQGPLRITELARLLQVQQPGITEMVGGMEQANLVRRRHHDADRRGIVVEITPEGKAAYDKAHELRAAEFSRYLESLSAAERAVLRESIPIYEVLIEKMGKEQDA
jgi:DNA-binding MarR family transcriptional regulator